VLLGVLAIVGAFWRRSLAETRRAEAANLFSMAQLQLEDHPSATVAYAIGSLERADIPAVRLLALEALWRGPTEIRLPAGSMYGVDFSPDGRWLLTSTERGGAKLWPSDGGPATELDSREISGEAYFSPNGDLIGIYDTDIKNLGLWSASDGRFLRWLEVGGEMNQLFWFSRDGTRVTTCTENLKGNRDQILIRSWPVDGDDPDVLAQAEVGKESMRAFCGVDPTGTHSAWVDGKNFKIRPLKALGAGSPPAVSLQHDHNLLTAVFDDDGRQVATSDMSGRISVWALDQSPPRLIRTFDGLGQQVPRSLRFDASGTMLGLHGAYLDDLDAPPDVEWQPLRRAQGAIESEQGETGFGVAFHPQSTWLATGHVFSVSLWPLSRAYPKVILRNEKPQGKVAFTPDGKSLVFRLEDGSIQMSSLDSGLGRRSTILYSAIGQMDGGVRPTIAPDGSFVAFSTYAGSVWVVPLDGGPSRELTGFTDVVRNVAVGPRSRLVAAGGGTFIREQAFVRVWDLESGETRILDAGDGKAIGYLEFSAEGDLLVDSGLRVLRWDLRGATPRIAEEFEVGGPFGLCGQRAGGDEILFAREGHLAIHDFEEDITRELNSHGTLVYAATFDPTGEIVVSTDRKGVIRVGPVSGEEPHLLLRQEGLVGGAFSPDGRWIATSGGGTIRLWPMPDLSTPPLHTLPREELLAKLKSLTNLRVVEAPDSPSGWKLEIGPFPGWETVPTW
jgi:WD40 repeat protein